MMTRQEISTSKKLGELMIRIKELEVDRDYYATGWDMALERIEQLEEELRAFREK